MARVCARMGVRPSSSLQEIRDGGRERRTDDMRLRSSKVCALICAVRAVGAGGVGTYVGGAGGVRGHMYDVGSTFVSVILEAG